MRLKWGETAYKGTLVSIDSYMNIQLSNTEEFIDNKSTGALGQVLIRCGLWNIPPRNHADNSILQVQQRVIYPKERPRGEGRREHGRLRAGGLSVKD